MKMQSSKSSLPPPSKFYLLTTPIRILYDFVLNSWLRNLYAREGMLYNFKASCSLMFKQCSFTRMRTKLPNFRALGKRVDKEKDDVICYIEFHSYPVHMISSNIELYSHFCKSESKYFSSNSSELHPTYPCVLVIFLEHYCGGKFLGNFPTPRVATERTDVINRKQHEFMWKNQHGRENSLYCLGITMNSAE